MLVPRDISWSSETNHRRKNGLLVFWNFSFYWKLVNVLIYILDGCHQEPILVGLCLDMKSDGP